MSDSPDEDTTTTTMTTAKNLHGNPSPTERLDRLFMFLEAQFGPNITPFTHPRRTTTTSSLRKSSTHQKNPSPEDNPNDDHKGDEKMADCDSNLEANGNGNNNVEGGDHDDDDDDGHDNEDEEEEEEEEEEGSEEKELARLHHLGIPVPAIDIRVDHHLARVWLEDLTVECVNRTLRDRVLAVLDRAVETIAPLWMPDPSNHQ